MSNKKEEVIKLRAIEGIARLSGIDQDGNHWIQFEVDSFAEQLSGECCICGAELESGWMCLDGGDEVCDRHIILESEGEEETDSIPSILGEDGGSSPV